VDSRGKFVFVLLAVLLIILGWLSFELIRPFLTSIMWAIILAIAFHPVHRWIQRHVRGNGLSSVLTLILILLIIVGPISYLAYRFVSELVNALHYLQTEVQRSGGVHSVVTTIFDKITSKLGVPAGEFSGEIQRVVGGIVQSAAQKLQENAGAFLRIGPDFLFMAIALFFVLRDGLRVAKRILDRIPMSAARKADIGKEFEDVIASTFYSNAISMGGHGVLGLVLFYAFGLPAPVLMAAATALLSVIPVIGSLFVWAGAILYLFFNGKIGSAVAMLVISGVGTQLIDHWLRAYLVGLRLEMPFFTVFFGILGGLEYFGLIGIVIGPLILIMFQSIAFLFWQIWVEFTADTDNNP